MEERARIDRCQNVGRMEAATRIHFGFASLRERGGEEKVH